MTKLFLAVCLLFAITFAQAQPDAGPGLAQTELLENAPIFVSAAREANNKINHPAGKIDLSSPELTVRSFVWAYNLGDLKSALQCVQNAPPNEHVRAYEAALKQHIQSLNVRIGDLHSYQNDERATVTLLLTNQPEIENHSAGSTCERLHLRRENDIWRIIPSIAPLQPDNEWTQEDSLARLAKFMGTPDGSTIERQYSLAKSCQSNLRQVGLAFWQFVRDSEGAKFPARSDFKNQLKPYIVDDRIYLCPNVELQSGFSLNAALFDKPLAGLNSQTIIIYEGKDQKIEFRHHFVGQDWTNIVFINGEAKSYSKESLEAALKNGEVRWKP